MTFIVRLLPHPVVSLTILALWMVLAQGLSLGDLLLGAALALFIPIATNGFWPDRPRLHRPVRAVRLFARILTDIIVANWQVALLVLGPIDRLAPKFIEVPLAIDDDFVATLLGSIVSLTPGTVSIEIDRSRNLLLVHGLNVRNEDEMIANIKSRYEAPLREIFQC